jgi:hypothetical protein
MPGIFHEDAAELWSSRSNDDHSYYNVEIDALKI